MTVDVDTTSDSDTDVALPIVDVRLVADLTQGPDASEHASWRTVSFTGTNADIPQQLLPQDRNRHRAVIINNATGNDCIVGSKRQAIAQPSQAMPPVSGGVLPKGTSIVYESAEELWLIPSGLACMITVLDERNNNE